MKSRLSRTLKLKDGTVYSVGTEFNIMPLSTNPDRGICLIDQKGREISLKATSAGIYFEHDFVQINQDAIDEAIMDGGCPSLIGDTVEPDGHDEHGFPSILLACGLC